jgi:hypothetical protein
MVSIMKGHRTGFLLKENAMIRSGKGVRLLCSWGVMTMLLFFVMIDSGRAQTAKPDEAGGVQTPSAGESPILTGAVEGFTMDRVYIDGMDYALSKNIEYYSSRGEPVTTVMIKRGSRVKYVLGPSRAVEVIQLEKEPDDDAE